MISVLFLKVLARIGLTLRTTITATPTTITTTTTTTTTIYLALLVVHLEKR